MQDSRTFFSTFHVTCSEENSELRELFSECKQFTCRRERQLKAVRSSHAGRSSHKIVYSTMIGSLYRSTPGLLQASNMASFQDRSCIQKTFEKSSRVVRAIVWYSIFEANMTRSLHELRKILFELKGGEVPFGTLVPNGYKTVVDADCPSGQYLRFHWQSLSPWHAVFVRTYLHSFTVTFTQNQKLGHQKVSFTCELRTEFRTSRNVNNGHRSKCSESPAS